MSRKGVPPGGSKSKKIPRIFQRRRSASPGRCPGTSTAVIATAAAAVDRTAVFGYESALSEGQKKLRRKSVGTVKSHVAERSSTNNNNNKNNNNFYTECRAEDAETVAKIERWLKTRTESVSSMDLDAIKSEVEEVTAVDHRYLGDELPHAFLDKDADVLSMDIDLSDKKLTLGYDPILQDIRSDKLLEACEKDEFILPAFQLDHLDSLTLTPEDMMVAGEILPSATNQSSLNNTASSILAVNASGQEENSVQRTGEERDWRVKGISDNVREDVIADRRKTEAEIGPSKRIVNVYVEAVGHVDVETDSIEASETAAPEKNEVEEKPKLKTKLEPRIIKKRRKALPKGDGCSGSFRVLKTDEQSGGMEGIMAVVAISTDKISNMTQIVINTGKEEQIYQGKTSELIEATGNFSQLSRISNSCNETQNVELIADGSNSNEHDLVISNALEELGITDDTLEPISSTEHGKMWVCPREDCRKQFNRLCVLKGHVLSHYGVRPFKCDFKGCAWGFYSEFKLKRHKETHLKRKDYVCEIDNCGRRFTTIYNLLTHKKLHNRPSKVFCHVPNCHEKFQTKRALELHMRSHDQSHAPYVCKQEGCGKKYYSSNALTSHQRCHSYKEIDVKCLWPGCGKLFDKPCRLKAHIRSHTGYKPYLCTFQGCNWAFSSSSKLKRHQKKHTNERKFICDVSNCGKAFMRSEHLKEHRLTHKDGRYFQCHMCEAKFSAKSSLYVHIKKHQTQDVVSSLQNAALIDQQNFSAAAETADISFNEEFESNVGNSSIDESQETSQSLDLDLKFDSIVVDTPLTSGGQCTVTYEMTGGPNGIGSSQNSGRVAYRCPIESCTKVYAAKSTLRAHMLKIHGNKNGEEKGIEDAESFVAAASCSASDYVVYPASPESQSVSADHMITAATHDALVESPTLNSILKMPDSSRDDSVQCPVEEESADEERGLEEDNDGCARTYFTYNDFLRFKANSTILNSVVGPTDVVLSAAGLVEGLLLSEDLPSVYYQDDIAGTECQVLLLDSGHPESTINLRDLE